MANIVSQKTTKSKNELLDCKSSYWSQGNRFTVEMATTPLANQPSPYIKATYDENAIGLIKELKMMSCHNSEQVFFYFEWKSETPNFEIGNIGTFPDAVAILLPFKDSEKTPIKEMGTKDFPTNGWYWRPDFEEKPKNQVAHGLATSIYTKDSSLFSTSKWENGLWKVVIGRSLKVNEEAVNFEPGMKTVIGFAAWEGGNGERGGVKAFSKEWLEFELQA
ncbi:MAG: hypothetical protein KJ737_27770 [Proteobacteria bacterium]|nr:hypothetical protein [Pseudomonadota bacterium]